MKNNNEVLEEKVDVPTSVVKLISDNKKAENRIGKVFDIIFSGIELITTIPEEFIWVEKNQELFAKMYLNEEGETYK